MIKNILITGGSGFIGSHLIEILKQQTSKYNIIALSSSEIEGITAILHKNYTFTKDDFIQQGIKNIGIVIHAGAFTPKSHANGNDIVLSNSNILHTQHLFENLPSIPEKVILLSTTDVYQPTEDPIQETTDTNPLTLYGWSKLYCEKLLVNWCIQNQSVLNILRVGNTYGRGEGAYQKIIPLTIRKCLKNESPVIYTDGKEKRSFLHVLDCAKAIVKAIDIHENNIINIASSESKSVYEIASIIKNYINPELSIIIKNEFGNGRNVEFDSSKMNAKLHVPEVSFETGIWDEIAYFKNE